MENESRVAVEVEQETRVSSGEFQSSGLGEAASVPFLTFLGP